MNKKIYTLKQRDFGRVKNYFEIRRLTEDCRNIFEERGGGCGGGHGAAPPPFAGGTMRQKGTPERAQ